MNTNKSLTTIQLAQHHLMLKKETIEDSLCVLKNAHYSLSVTLNKIQELGLLEDNEMITILQEEMNVIEIEIIQLNLILKNELI